jgi:hypothetical protein
MLEIDDFGNLINIVVFLFLKNLATACAFFVGIYVYLMTAAQQVSIFVSWPRGYVVFTKKVAKMVKNWELGSF